MAKRSARTAATAVAVTTDDIEKALAGEASVSSYMSLSYHLRMHRPCRDDDLEPTDGSRLHVLWRKGQLTRQQLKGWQLWFSDVLDAIGNSNGLCIGYEPRGDGGSASNDHAAFYGPSTYWNAAQYRVEWSWSQLHFHERGLLAQLLLDALEHLGVKGIHAHDFRYLGGFMSGYNDNRQQIAACVSAVQRLLTSLAETYNVKHTYG